MNPVVNDHLGVVRRVDTHSVHAEESSNQIDVIALSNCKCVVEVTDDLLHQSLTILHVSLLQERESICDVFTSQLLPALGLHLCLKYGCAFIIEFSRAHVVCSKYLHDHQQGLTVYLFEEFWVRELDQLLDLRNVAHYFLR